MNSLKVYLSRPSSVLPLWKYSTLLYLGSAVLSVIGLDFLSTATFVAGLCTIFGAYYAGRVTSSGI